MRRGRPPDPETRSRALAAARRLLDSGGVPAVTMEAVAAQARVGKPTLYRSWPNAQALAMAALMSGDAAAPVSAADEPLAALRHELHALRARFAGPRGRSAAALLAASDADSELAKAFRSHVVMASRDIGRGLLEQAIAAGRVRADVDREAALDLVFGPLFFRRLMGHGPLAGDFVDAVLDQAMSGLAPRP